MRVISEIAEVPCSKVSFPAFLTGEFEKCERLQHSQLRRAEDQQTTMRDNALGGTAIT
jgi:hypothetical protein